MVPHKSTELALAATASVMLDELLIALKMATFVKA